MLRLLCFSLSLAILPGLSTAVAQTRDNATTQLAAPGTKASVLQIQEALAAQGFSPGAPDGAMGPRTRSAIAEFQRALGVAATGRLLEAELEALVLGAPVIAALETAPITIPIPQPAQPAAAVSVEEPIAEAALAEFSPLPGPSLTQHCEKVMLLSAARGGPMQVAEGSRDLALAESFCAARGAALEAGEARLGALPGVAPADAEAQCLAFEPVLSPAIAPYAEGLSDDALQAAAAIAEDSGLTAAEMAHTAEVCLAVAYREDQMDLAIGTLLLRVATGAQDHSELLGHHLNEGFGVPRNLLFAETWFEMAIYALEAGETLLFPESASTRATLLSWAAFPEMEPAGEPVEEIGQEAQPAPVAKPAAAVPSFLAPAVSLDGQ